ncbi:hypothetical protein MVEN_01593400 [Mycena venus]|uniref:Uncharacterized protein n=1 Tax=Mycena venus TaxID=2733690 RepID=A0A8H7CRN2_9AGAR|nr:hypothetical protein MVEN_01593400 [Mycena venus]
MLLLIFLVHAFSTNSHPLPGLHLDPRAPTESCDDINNCRKLFDIIWGCLVTIFAATWVSVHPNVPPTQPESARSLLVKAEDDAYRNCCSGSYGRIRSQAIFCCTVVCKGGHNPVTTAKQLRDSPECLHDISAVDVEDIKDKSKGDALSKGVALLQGLWFITQCLARIRQNLPVTKLEVATGAFAVINVFIWILWWNKPLDVQRPILVGSKDISNNKPLDNHGPEENLDTPAGVFLDGIRGAATGYYDTYNSTSYTYTSVPSFWATATDDDNQGKVLYSFLLEVLVGTIFGGIHCAAWNVDFLSTKEMWMWRSFSLTVAAVPVVLVSMVFLGARVAYAMNLDEDQAVLAVLIHLSDHRSYYVARQLAVTQLIDSLLAPIRLTTPPSRLPTVVSSASRRVLFNGRAVYSCSPLPWSWQHDYEQRFGASTSASASTPTLILFNATRAASMLSAPIRRLYLCLCFHHPTASVVCAAPYNAIDGLPFQLLFEVLEFSDGLSPIPRLRFLYHHLLLLRFSAASVTGNRCRRIRLHHATTALMLPLSLPKWMDPSEDGDDVESQSEASPFTAFPPSSRCVSSKANSSPRAYSKPGNDLSFVNICLHATSLTLRLYTSPSTEAVVAPRLFSLTHISPPALFVEDVNTMDMGHPNTTGDEEEVA